MLKELEKYLEEKRHEMHKTCLTDKFDNGYFWAVKDIEAFIKKNYCEHAWSIGGADCICCTKCEKEIFYHE